MSEPTLRINYRYFTAFRKWEKQTRPNIPVRINKETKLDRRDRERDRVRERENEKKDERTKQWQTISHPLCPPTYSHLIHQNIIDVSHFIEYICLCVCVCDLKFKFFVSLTQCYCCCCVIFNLLVVLVPFRFVGCLFAYILYAHAQFISMCAYIKKGWRRPNTDYRQTRLRHFTFQ